jgi:hypothetical protein
MAVLCKKTRLNSAFSEKTTQMTLETLKKLNFRNKATGLNLPEAFKPSFEQWGFKQKLLPDQPTENVIVFLKDSTDFLRFLSQDLPKIKYDTVLWFAYPKGTSGVKTDINRDILWQMALQFGIRPVSSVAIDSVWSALRFRPIEKVQTK